MNGTWLEQILQANGQTIQDLQEQTGLDTSTINELLNDQTGTRPEWNEILTWYNNLPTIWYPDKTILDQIRQDITNDGEEAPAIVYYGVNAKDLIFAGYQNLADMQYHGAQVHTDQLAKLHITLGETLEQIGRAHV